MTYRDYMYGERCNYYKNNHWNIFYNTKNLDTIYMFNSNLKYIYMFYNIKIIFSLHMYWQNYSVFILRKYGL